MPGDTQRVMAFSDSHGVVDWHSLAIIHNPDITVMAGDIAPLSSLTEVGRRWQRMWVMENIPYLSKNCRGHVVIVPGNHDLWALDNDVLQHLSMFNRIHVLVDRGVVINGISFWGSPHIPHIRGMWAFEHDEEFMFRQFSRMREGTDVMVTHTPPRLEGERVDIVDGDEEHRHIGSTALARVLDTKSPRWLFCGHVHTGSHEPIHHGNTKVVNVSLLDETYSSAYKPVFVDIEPKGKN